jgi:hypothetical protein
MRRVFVALRAHRSPRDVVELYFRKEQILFEGHQNIHDRWYFIVEGDPIAPFKECDDIRFATDREGYAAEFLHSVRKGLPENLERLKEQFAMGEA